MVQVQDEIIAAALEEKVENEAGLIEMKDLEVVLVKMKRKSQEVIWSMKSSSCRNS